MYALLIYKTGILFRFCNTADDQIGGPGRSSLVPRTEEKGHREFAAAHMATLPALQLYIADQVHNSVAFGRGSYFHRCANATTWLPVVVNHVDTALDQKTKVPAFSHSFRYFTTGLLNNLSEDKLPPHNALYFFLTRTLEHLPQISVSEKGEMRQIVINCYREVAEAYLKKMSESTYLIKALCGAFKDESPIDRIYMKVQAQMHKQFADEMSKLRPVFIADPKLELQLTTTLNPQRFHSFITEFLRIQTEKAVLAVTKTIFKYSKASVQVKNVRTVALRYLVGVPDTHTLELGLKTVLNVKLQATISKVSLCPHLFDIYSEIIKVLVPNITKNPKHMNAIMIRVLSEVAGNSTI